MILYLLLQYAMANECLNNVINGVNYNGPYSDLTLNFCSTEIVANYNTIDYSNIDTTIIGIVGIGLNITSNNINIGAFNNNTLFITGFQSNPIEAIGISGMGNVDGDNINVGECKSSNITLIDVNDIGISGIGYSSGNGNNSGFIGDYSNIVLSNDIITGVSGIGSINPSLNALNSGVINSNSNINILNSGGIGVSGIGGVNFGTVQNTGIIGFNSTITLDTTNSVGISGIGFLGTSSINNNYGNIGNYIFMNLITSINIGIC